MMGSRCELFDGVTDYMQAVCASADGEIVAGGGEDGVLRVWKKDGSAVLTFDGQNKVDKIGKQVEGS